MIYELGIPLLRTEDNVKVRERAQVQAKLDADKKRDREKSRKETAEKIKEAKLLAPSKGSTRSSKMTSLGAASKKDADIDDAMVCIPLLAVLELPILTNEYLA